MTQCYSAEGNVVPVTVVETGPCVVVQKKQPDKDGYSALQVGFGSKKAQRVNKAEQGHMGKAGKGAFEVLREFRLDDVSSYEVGQEIKVTDLFKVGDLIDVAGVSKGHGFTGVIKRWSLPVFQDPMVLMNISVMAAPSATVRIRAVFVRAKKWPDIGAMSR